MTPDPSEVRSHAANLETFGLQERCAQTVNVEGWASNGTLKCGYRVEDRIHNKRSRQFRHPFLSARSLGTSEVAAKPATAEPAEEATGKSETSESNRAHDVSSASNARAEPLRGEVDIGNLLTVLEQKDAEIAELRAAGNEVVIATEGWTHGEECPAMWEENSGTDGEAYPDSPKCDCGFSRLYRARRALRGGT